MKSNKTGPARRRFLQLHAEEDDDEEKRRNEIAFRASITASADVQEDSVKHFAESAQ